MKVTTRDSTRTAASLRRRLSAAVGDGIDEHVPAAVGIVVRGVPAVGLVALAHLVCGVSLPVTAILAAGGAGVAVAGTTIHRTK